MPRKKKKNYLVEKELHPFASRTVDLSNKSKDFKTMYKTIHPDHQAGAKVPILEVGFPSKGEKDYVQLVESSVCTKYIATVRWPYRGVDQGIRSTASLARLCWETSMLDLSNKSNDLAAARIDLFVDMYMGNVVPGLL